MKYEEAVHMSKGQTHLLPVRKRGEGRGEGEGEKGDRRIFFLSPSPSMYNATASFRYSYAGENVADPASYGHSWP